MALSGNSQLLVDTLEALPLLNGRFSGVKLVNAVNGVKRGNFSLVFKAYDEINERFVALKFFDLDPTKRNTYRLLCFRREHQILELLKGAPRCLQLTSEFLVFDLQIPIAGHPGPITIPAEFFATEWIEEDLDKFFVDQDQVAALDKLHVFNEIVLAVESIHARSVFHRDLKADNFRARENRKKREIVAIDLGTAAAVESGPVLPSYGSPIGFLLYSAPEAFCGLAGSRLVAPLTDKFALGCLLFELFHPDDFPTAFRAVNPDYDMRFAALQSRIDGAANEEEKLKQWAREAPRALLGLSPVTLEDHGSSAPPAIEDLLTGLVTDLTESDFQKRTIAYSEIRLKVWRAIRIIESNLMQKRRAALAAKRRAARAAKAEAKALRAEKRVILAPSGV